MTIKRLVALAVLVLAAAFPSAAGAQLHITPPEGDNYLDAIPFTDPGPFSNSEVGFIADTSSYTTQSDVFVPEGTGGGPAEPTLCGNTTFGNTIWSFFRADRYGIMNLSTAGNFDSVIAIMPFNSPRDAEPHISQGICWDRLGGFSETGKVLVQPRRWYAVQVGGTGTPPGGQVETKFLLEPPPAVDGAAFLFWKVNPLRVSDMYVKGVPKGETLTLSCTKGACKKRTIKVKSKQAAGQLLPGPGAGLKRAGGAGSLKVATKQAHAAAKRVQILKNHKVKPGAKIELRIKRTGYIGKYYRWKVGKNEISSAKSFCMNAGSNKPQTKNKCHG
jgi:hypothetical protein